MKIPDKIYLLKVELEERWSLTEASELEPKKEECYIRKDALLEWAKDLKHIYEIPVNNHQASRICRVKAEAFQLVIDKLNSM